MRNSRARRPPKQTGWLGFVTILTGLVVALACNENTGTTPVVTSEPEEIAAAPNAPLTESEIQRLLVLGYLEASEETVDPTEDAVSLYDPERSAPGYNLISNRFLGTAQLFDARGELIHTWAPDGIAHIANVELLENGNLLVTGAAREKDTGYVMLLSWDGEVLLDRRIMSHHDADWMPGGRIAALTRTSRRLPSVSADAEIRDNGIAILDPEGNVVEEHSLAGLMNAAKDRFTFQRLPRMEISKRHKSKIDLLHTNSIEFMRYPEYADRHRLYEQGNVLISIRHQDTVAVIDWNEKKLVWAWGQGELSGQHDAQQLENGNFLIFDNGLKNQSSRVIELDPVREEIVWEYPQPGQPSFYTWANGSSQRLSNGNTLIGNSDHGEAFEVTRDGDIVWHFKNPNANAEGKRATFVRIKRYPEHWIEPLLMKR